MKKALEVEHQSKLNLITEKLSKPETIIESAKSDIKAHQETIQKLIDDATAADTVAEQAQKAEQVKFLKDLEKKQNKWRQKN